jgi:hypothetical protein
MLDAEKIQSYLRPSTQGRQGEKGLDINIEKEQSDIRLLPAYFKNFKISIAPT